MKVIVIGSHLCQDTLYALYKLKDQGVDVEFKNLSANFQALKEFLYIRDTNPLYAEVKEKGGIGMPFFEMEDGTQTLDLQYALKRCK